MTISNSSAVSVCVAVLAIASAFAFVGTVDISSTDATVVGEKSNQQVIDIELDQLAVSLGRSETFSLDKVPRTIRSLHNKKIRIRGHMLPEFEETGITEFWFTGETRSKGCSWAADLKHVPVHYYIDVSLLEGHRVDYSFEAFVVEGIFRIEPDIIDGELIILFRIDDATLKPAKRRVGYHPAVWSLC
ncbi:MAG: hypothetical protein ACKVHE_12105 [Planctomycetales bacterium]|jgi:hypothetical protein